MRYALSLLLCAIPLHAQTTGTANTVGPCSPAVTGNNNQFMIKCEGLTKLEGDKILAVMNKILANQLDTATVLKKLDEIQKTRPLNQNCPNGICAGGDITGNPTVYNAPPQRKLSAEQKNALANCLQQNPGKFTVASLANNSEAYKYAQDWYDVFTSAHWTNEQPIPIAIFTIGGGMWSGERISISGDWDVASQRALLKEGSPEKDALVCFQNANGVGGIAIPYKDKRTGTIRIDISDQPELPKTAP
jgi:hypothetical protein